MLWYTISASPIRTAHLLTTTSRHWPACHLTSRVYKDLNWYILWIWTMHKICTHLYSIIQSSFTALKSHWALNTFFFFFTFRLLTLDIMDSSCSTFLTTHAFPNGCSPHASLCLRFQTHQQAGHPWGSSPFLLCWLWSLGFAIVLGLW